MPGQFTRKPRVVVLGDEQEGVGSCATNHGCFNYGRADGLRRQVKAFSPAMVRRGKTIGVWIEHFPFMVVMALLARVGLSVFGIGQVRSKHAASTAGRAIVELCFLTFAYWAIGVMFVEPAGSTNGVVGIEPKAAIGLTSWGFAACAALFPVILLSGMSSGLLAERVRFWPAMIACVVLGGVTIPIAAGWMAVIPKADGAFTRFLELQLPIALPLVSAMAFGWMALGAVGARTGKYRRDGSTALIPAHNLPVAMVGALIAIVGLSGLVIPWSGPDKIIPAIAFAGVVAACVTQWKFGKPDIGLITLAVVGAAVAMVCAGVSPGAPGWACVLMGGVAGAVVPHFAYVFEMTFKRDDPSGQLAVLGVGAAIGAIYGSVWATGGDPWFIRLTAALAGVLVAGLWGVLTGWFTLIVLKKVTKLRASEADEFDGLDLAEHDVSAYPDFQQNTIRSFHMREA